MFKSKIYRIKIFTLLLFVFSLPFEYWDPYGIAYFFTVTKFVGLFYMLLSLFDLKENLRLKDTKTPVLILLLLWVLLFFQSVFNNKYNSPISIYNFSFFQNIILFWLLSNDLIKNNRLFKYLLVSLIAGVSLMGLLVSIGIGLDLSIDSELGSYRLTFFGSNPNGVGNLAAVALFFVLGMLLNKEEYFNNKTYYFALTIPNLLMLLSLSGSRGALVISLIGVIVIFFFQTKSLKKRILSIALGIIFLLFGFSKILESQVMQSRVALTTTEGSLGGREEIWRHALDIFYENPFFGVGTTGYYNEMVQRYGVYMDTHNLFLYFMVTGGVVALFLYLLFLRQLFLSAKKNYLHKKDVILYGLLLIYIFSVVKSGGAINSKLYWILASMVFGVGSSRYYIKRAY